MEHGGFGSEAYAREELRAEIAAMMTGEQLGVGHEPRHGTAYVSSWIKALENDPKEIRAAAVDAQRISDWLMARERERSKEAERTEHEPPGSDAGRTHEHGQPDRSEAATVGVREPIQTDHGPAEPGMGASAGAPRSADREPVPGSGPSR